MKPPIPPRPGERGAALLAVLLLVSVMGALTATALERLSLSVALAANNSALDQARAFAVGVESLLTLTADDVIAQSPERTTLAGGWNGQVRQIPMPGGGIAHATLRDGGNCFNINSVAEGVPPNPLLPRTIGTAQFAALLRTLEVPEGEALRIAQAAGDWVDSDSNPNREGAEDGAYAGGEQPYLVGNTPFAEVSELRALAGMTPEIYERVRPWLCALPTTDLSPINVNTLSPDQAPLVAMLAPGQITIEAARQAIAARPTSGWSSASEFFTQPALVAVQFSNDVTYQAQLRTSWFRLDLRVELRGAELIETALVDARIPPARVVVRRWGNDD